MALRSFFDVLKSRRNPSRINTFLMRSYSAYGRFVKKDLFSRISTIGDPNQSVAPVLDKWVEEGNKVKGLDLKPIIRDLRSRRRYTHALQVTSLSLSLFLFVVFPLCHFPLIKRWVALAREKVQESNG